MNPNSSQMAETQAAVTPAEKRRRLNTRLSIVFSLLSFLFIIAGFVFLPQIYLYSLGAAVISAVAAVVLGTSAYSKTPLLSERSKAATIAFVLAIVTVIVASILLAISGYIEYYFWKHPMDGPLVPIPVPVMLK